MAFCPNHLQRLLAPGETTCSLCRPVRKDVNVSLDAQLGKALREYAKSVRLPMNEITYRALLCYWIKQGTKEAVQAVNTADLKTNEAWSAFLDEGEFSDKA